MSCAVTRWFSYRQFPSAVSIQKHVKYATIASTYNKWMKLFDERCISEPDASADYIVAHVLGRKTLNGVDMNHCLSASEIEKIHSFCMKRITKMPIQYVIEEWDFGDLNLKMKPPVFIPRPETQGLLNVVVEDVNASTSTNVKLLEVGCGSGAITLSLLNACNQDIIKKQLDITAIDKDLEAIQLTEENATLTKAKDFELLHCDVQSFPRDRRFDGIVSNPPYIPTKELRDLQPEISQYESRLALDGGSDGLDVVRDIVQLADDVLSLQGWIWLEVDTTHPELLRNLFENFELAAVVKDFLDKDRFVKLVKVS